MSSLENYSSLFGRQGPGKRKRVWVNAVKLVRRAGMEGGLWLKKIGRCRLANSTYFLLSGL